MQKPGFRGFVSVTRQKELLQQVVSEQSMKMPAEKSKDCSDITDIICGKQEQTNLWQSAGHSRLLDK